MQDKVRDTPKIITSKSAFIIKVRNLFPFINSNFLKQPGHLNIESFAQGLKYFFPMENALLHFGHLSLPYSGEM